MFPELINSDVVLTNARDVHGPVVAEQVMAMIFALARCLPQSVRFQQKHIWDKVPSGAGILGRGNWQERRSAWWAWAASRAPSQNTPQISACA